MKLYLDTGNVEEIRRAVATHVLDGVTTNPSLIAKEGKRFEATVKEIATAFTKAGKKEFTVSAETMAETAEEMVVEGLRLSKIDPHIIVKVPITVEGVKAIALLSKKKVRTNATLCFTPNQALLAAKAGAYFVSPFLGRLDDANEDSIALIRAIRRTYDTHKLTTKILAASIRNAAHVAKAAEAGADIATLPPKVFWELYEHPLTAAGLERFRQDWDAYRRKRGE